MERVFNKARSHEEAQEWDVLQQINMTPEERQQVAHELKRRVYGKNPPDVRTTRKCNKV